MAPGISALSYAIPKGTLTNQELESRFGKDNMNRILMNTGITKRRVANNSECASDFAYSAAMKILNNEKEKKKEIDFIIFATQMPDYLLPTTACILQDKLNLPKTIGAIDINLGCSQYVYAHANAFALVKSNLAKRVLVMTGDTPSRIIDPDDRSVVPLFGDGGTAAIIEELGEGFGFEAFKFGTDGSGSDSLIWPESGLRKTQNINNSKNNYMKMNGQNIFIFTLKTVPKSLNIFLDEQKINIDDIDFFAFHQASKMIVDSIQKKLKIPNGKINHIYSNRGNSGGSTVGISLSHALKQGVIKPGSKVVISAFGVGLSWAHALLIWPEKEIPNFSVE